MCRVPLHLRNFENIGQSLRFLLLIFKVIGLHLVDDTENIAIQAQAFTRNTHID
jgi:hypothetical protein